MDMNELVTLITRNVLEQLAQGKRECVMALCPKDSAFAPRVEDIFKAGADVVFSGESLEGRTPSRYILPFLSCSDMAALAAGQALSSSAERVLTLLLSGMEVEVLEWEYAAFSETAPYSLYQLYERYKETLAGFGLVSFREEAPQEVRMRDKLITAVQVNEAGKLGSPVLVVPASAIVTPLAEEAAKDLHMTILKKL